MTGLYWIAVVGIPTVFYAAGKAFATWLSFKQKVLQEAARQAADIAARHVATIERLEHRVGVLERIITESNVATATQINKLRIAPLN
jgi:hypothetical protein